MRGVVMVVVVMVVVMAGLGFGVTTASPEMKQDECFVPPGNSIIANTLADALEAARPLLTTGVPSLSIPPLDPLGPIPQINFKIDEPGLRMEGFVNQTVIKNIASFIICSLNFTVAGIVKQKFAAEFRLDNWHMEGQYELDGLIASLFPVYGGGNFRLDTKKTGFSGSATTVVNLIQERASIKDLTFDVFFETLQLEFECLLGCGDMSDLINGVAGQLGPPIFEAVWEAIQPTLTSYVEAGINEVLQGIPISITASNEQDGKPRDLGNANDFVDALMPVLAGALVTSGLDPAPMGDTSISLLGASVDLFGGQVSGLSKMHRSGTCTLDKVASWVFLYANLGDESLRIEYQANISTGVSHVSTAHISGSVEVVGVYMVARQDVFGLVTDIDQFVVDDFGKIDVSVEGLGVLGYLVGPLTEAVVNLVREDLANLLEGEVKALLQDILGETPWPRY